MFETPKNTIEFKVYGKYALFTSPITKLGGEKCSYLVPTYEAIKGIARSIYWKPTFIWIIDKVRVMKSIEMEAKGIRTIKYHGGNGGLYYYTYLRDVEYQISAHFEWNKLRQDLQKDQEDGKHFAIAKRSLERGGRQDVFLGTRECQGYVKPCAFGDEKSFYQERKLLSFGSMFHSFGYPSETGKNELTTKLWVNSNMKNGIINFDENDNRIVERRNVVTMNEQINYIFDKNFLKVEKEHENMFVKRGKML